MYSLAHAKSISCGVFGLLLIMAGCAGSSARHMQDATPLHVKVLAINDFHGQIVPGKTVGERPVGSIPVLASYLKSAMAGIEERTLVVHAGDLVGGSPPESALLQDEPSVMFMNLLANDFCRKDRMSPRCNMVATVGNHEFDEGVEEMLRLINGGNHRKGPFLQTPYEGAHFPYIASNLVDASSRKRLLPPFIIKEVGGMTIGIVGATLKETPSHVTPAGVASVRFLDEAESINVQINELKRLNVRAVVVLLHKGGHQYPPKQKKGAGEVTGEIVDIINRLDSETDVVISGDTHSYTNALMKNREGKEILVTQAYSAGSAYADIDIEIDRKTRDVVRKKASIVTTFADTGPGLAPDTEAAKLLAASRQKVAPLVDKVVGRAAVNIVRMQNAAGEAPLGSLIADAQRVSTGADFAFVNSGGIRTNIGAGEVTWGELFAVQPFGNHLLTVQVTGQQIYNLLEQQWVNQPEPRMLQISGLSYTWDSALPAGNKVVEVRKEGVPIDRKAFYGVTANSFLAGGGDNFTGFTAGKMKVVRMTELEALVAYLKELPQPFSPPQEGRIVRLK